METDDEQRDPRSTLQTPNPLLNTTLLSRLPLPPLLLHQFVLDCFQGLVLTNAHTHFDRKASLAASINEGDDRVNANRCCAALLSCAGNMPPSSVTGMVKKITEKVSIKCLCVCVFVCVRASVCVCVF